MIFGKKSKQPKPTFPEMVYQILEDSAREGTENIVAWELDGSAFIIHKPKVFNDTILPKYSRKRTKFRSFQRQLNIYGFKMTKKSGVYRHELFRRGDLHNITQIRPRTQGKKKTSDRDESDSESTRIRTNSVDMPLTPSYGVSDDNESKNEINSANSPPLLRSISLDQVDDEQSLNTNSEKESPSRAIVEDDHCFCSTVGEDFNFDLFDDLEGITFCDCNGCGCRFSSRRQ